MSFFPLANPRKSQEAVISQIEDAIKNKVKFVILEAPVGSGKSAIAMTIAKWLGDAHLLTPRKSLQNQYYEDFSEDVSLMKGRSSYPCIFSASVKRKRDIINTVELGGTPKIHLGEDTCAQGPCKDGNQAMYIDCMERNKECPYHAAIRVASDSPIVVHNLHSFIFQAHFADKFDKRRVLIVDEAHDIEGIVRDFTIKKHIVWKLIREEDKPDIAELDTLDKWAEYFSQPGLIPPETSDKHGQCVESIAKLGLMSEHFGKFVVKVTENRVLNYTKFEFIPDLIGNIASSLILNYGETVILMSGTIYNKNLFCKYVGINPEDAVFIKVGSSFPIPSRPIIMKPEYMVDTSHRMWGENFDEIIEKINVVCSKFPDVKGLIHAPSYDAARELTAALKRSGNDRVITHEPETFLGTLEGFFEMKENGIFISPVCQQGVDFKGDRARFQIVLRVPYGNAGDEFWAYKVKNDFPWYNYQALIVFGQQVGRVNRSESDFGVTVLMDSRFPQFISRNRSMLPKWLQDAIIRK